MGANLWLIGLLLFSAGDVLAEPPGPFDQLQALAPAELDAVRGTGFFRKGGLFGGEGIFGSDGLFGKNGLFGGGVVAPAEIRTTVTEQDGTTTVILETRVPNILDLPEPVVEEGGDPDTTLARHELSPEAFSAVVTNTVSDVSIRTQGTLTFDFSAASAAQMSEIAQSQALMNGVSRPLSIGLTGALRP